MKKDRKLKVGLVFDDSLDSNDGVSQYVKTLGAWLSARGCHVSYLVGQSKLTNWHGGKVYSLSRNLPVRFNGNQLSIPLPANNRRIKKLLEREKFDVLHIMVPYSPFMAQRVIKSAPREIAVVGTFHVFPSGPLAKVGGSLLRIWYGKSIKRFGKIVSVSAPAQTYAKESFGIDGPVIPNPVDTAKFSAALPAKPESRQIVFLGRLVKRKGCAQLINAFYELTKTVSDVGLVVAGDGPQRMQLERACQRLAITDRVKFLGHVSEADKPSILASADIACFPSLYGESFGIVLVEAMASGAGVVLGGDNPGYRSVLGAQPDLLVDAMDTLEFSNRLKRLLEDEALAGRLHKWQLKNLAQYDINVVGGQILDMYNGQIALRDKNSHNGSHDL